MIAEILLLLLGHKSSLFPSDHTIDPAFVPLLHPGEQQCLESLGLTAWQYRKVKAACARLVQTRSRYISALCSTLNTILADDYEALVVSIESQILHKDTNFVGIGSFVPLSSLRATFADWDAPFAALVHLMDVLEAKQEWQPGPLIDLLLERARSGVHKVSRILTQLSNAVQRVWMAQLSAFLLHSGSSLADGRYRLKEGVLPRVVTAQSRDSIAYVGRAIGTVRDAEKNQQLPRALVAQYVKLLDGVLPEDQHGFDQVIAEIRESVGEWLWTNVLTRQSVEQAVDTLSDYFLLRNGEFALAFIREIEQLKLSRLTARVAPSSMIREQDLHLAILRASLGTSAQHDASLAHLRCTLPNGPMRPLLPSLSGEQIKHTKPSQASLLDDLTTFDDLVLGTPMVLTYAVKWPLDLFLVPSDLKIYGALFSYMMSLRKTHMRVHACWASLSNAQRARRKWTGLNDGGTETDLKARKELLRYGWGVVRQMGWLLDTLLEYLMNDVVDVEFKRLKESLSHKQDQGTRLSASQLKAGMQESTGPSYIDFTSLRIMHTGYLNRLLVGSLLANPEVSMIIREILQICERFVAQVERWGGDVLPALLFEGSLSSETPEKAGSLVRERWKITTEINSSLQSLLHTFYEQLTASMSQQPVVAGADASRSVMHNITIADALTGFQTTIIAGKNGKGNDAEGDVRRHIERLLLRLDFNSAFSKPVPSAGEVLGEGANILKAGGLA